MMKKYMSKQAIPRVSFARTTSPPRDVYIFSYVAIREPVVDVSLVDRVLVNHGAIAYQ
jgi:hypothetical protein